MKCLFALCLLAACGGGSPPAAPSAPPSEAGAGFSDQPTAPAARDALVAEMLGRLGRVLSCANGTSVWCLAARGWDQGDAGPLPSAPVVLAGISVALIASEPDERLVRGPVTFSVLAVRPVGGETRALLVDIEPQNAAEQKVLDQAVKDAAQVLRGETPALALPPSLRRLVQRAAAEARHPVSRRGREWRFTGAAEARVRRAGPVWIAVELPPDGPRGMLLSLYTDRLAPP